MAGCLVITGRVVCVLLSIVQSILLVQFPIKYESNDYYWLLLLLYIPAFAGLLTWYARGCYLGHLWRVWLLYIVFLNITAAVVFGIVEPNLSADRAFGPEVFEVSLCISPLLLLLLLNVASDSSRKRGLVILISFRLTLDLFDGIAMLGETLDKAGRPRDGVPQEMRIAIYILVPLVFALSAFELRDQRFDGVVHYGFERKTSFRIRTEIQMVLNAAFLVLRLILWIECEGPAPIFIDKSRIEMLGDSVPQELRIAIYILVLLAFLLSAFELRDQSFGGIDHYNEGHEETSFRIVLQLVANAMFLVLRLILWIKFKRPAPMFIAKSGISVIVYLIEIAES